MARTHRKSSKSRKRNRQRRQPAANVQTQTQAAVVAKEQELANGPVVPEADVDEPEASAPAPARKSARAYRPYQSGKAATAAVARVTPRTSVLSREQEYSFIRHDLQRLLFTSGVLAVAMIATLFFIGR